MKAIRLRTDDLKNPLGLGDAAPRFSWNCQGGVRQTAYRILCKRGDCLHRRDLGLVQ